MTGFLGLAFRGVCFAGVGGPIVRRNIANVRQAEAAIGGLHDLNAIRIAPFLLDIEVAGFAMTDGIRGSKAGGIGGGVGGTGTDLVRARLFITSLLTEAAVNRAIVRSHALWIIATAVSFLDRSEVIELDGL